MTRKRSPLIACMRLPTLAVTIGWRMVAYIVPTIRMRSVTWLTAPLMTAGSFTA